MKVAREHAPDRNVAMSAKLQELPKIMNRTSGKIYTEKLLRSPSDQAFLPNRKLLGSGEGELLQRLLI